MTVKELYELTKSIMFEKQTSKDYNAYYIPNINLLLVELFDLNNDNRIFYDKEPLTEIPYIEKDSDELPYEENINRNVLPYGLAARFFIDDDLSKYDIFNTDYLNAQMRNQHTHEVSVTDVYGGN